MHPLSARDLLYVWERGAYLYPIDKALTLLGVACPDKAWEELAEISIGRRNALLMTLWKLSFGPRLDCYGECPECCEPLEFALDVAYLCDLDHGETTNAEFILDTEGFEVEFRLPNSLDLVEVAHCNDTETGREILIRRCLVRARQDDKEYAPDMLPEPVITELANQILHHDPLAEVRIDLNCPGCGHQWSQHLDIVPFFWAEISAEAKRILYEVHRLAQAYGWREADILTMSARRRQLYLEMVSS